MFDNDKFRDMVFFFLPENVMSETFNRKSSGKSVLSYIICMIPKKQIRVGILSKLPKINDKMIILWILSLFV